MNWLDNSIDNAREVLSNPEYFEELRKWNLEEVTDGYHSFKELYEYRMLYNAAFFNLLAFLDTSLDKPIVIKSKKHSDGEKCFSSDGWFIVQAELPTGQISNHYEMEYWDLFKVPEVEKANPWDGHTPKEAKERLLNYIKQMS